MPRKQMRVTFYMVLLLNVFWIPFGEIIQTFHSTLHAERAGVRILNTNKIGFVQAFFFRIL